MILRQIKCSILIWLLMHTILVASYSQNPVVSGPKFTEDASGARKFELKHILYNNADGYLADAFCDVASKSSNEEKDGVAINGQEINDTDMQFKVKSTRKKIIRMADRNPDFVESYLNYALELGDFDRLNSMIKLDWKKETISVPNITDRDTVLALAMMSSDAYAHLPDDPTWRDVGDKYDLGKGFGWKDRGLRGHIFVEKRKVSPRVIIALKGTSAAGITFGGDSDDAGDTVEDDKINDNLLFSCCCARVSSLWSTVCDCYEGSSYQCNQNCIEREMRRPDRYYKAALEIYRNVTAIYPSSEIWVTGHSLGGALASLLGRTYGLPAVTFEAPGELLPSRRLHLPVPPGLPEQYEYIWHFGNNADPIFLGVCNGASSSCNIAGYAMETQCHSGLVCTYDSVNDLGWHINMLNHRLKKVIDDIIVVYNDTPVCTKPPPCVDCYNWYFIDHSNEKFGTSLFPTPSSTSLPSGTPTDEPHERKCLKRTWYGKCYKWDDDNDDNDEKYDATSVIN